MARRNRKVAERHKSLQPVAPKANFTLAGARMMYTGMEGREFHCTVSGHCRTQIFEFPRIDFRPNGDESHQRIYNSPSVQACVTSDLVGYFVNATRGRHYDISPCLQHEVGETDKRIRSQQKGRVPVYLVIEENNELIPVEMIKGECSISDEVRVRDDEEVPVLVGGRVDEKFIIAWATVDGAWPTIPSNQQLVNLILAGVRVAQQTPDPIRKYVDQSCLVTDDGRFVEMMRPTMSARGQTATVMDSNTLRSRAGEIRKAVAAMESEIATPHMALLVNSMYSDEHKDDSYLRLDYLRLWQSLAEAGKTCLRYEGNVREDDVVVAGKKTLRELNEYRDDIAHWWTDTIDENFLTDLRRTVNELIRRRYFKLSASGKVTE